MMDFQNFGGLSWLLSIISTTWCVIHYYVFKSALSEGSLNIKSIQADLILKTVFFVPFPLLLQNNSAVLSSEGMGWLMDRLPFDSPP